MRICKANFVKLFVVLSSFCPTAVAKFRIWTLWCKVTLFDLSLKAMKILLWIVTLIIFIREKKKNSDYICIFIFTVKTFALCRTGIWAGEVHFILFILFYVLIFYF